MCRIPSLISLAGGSSETLVGDNTSFQTHEAHHQARKEELMMSTKTREKASLRHIDADDNRTAVFPEMLHILLDDVELRDEADVVFWHSSGRAFRVYKKQVFTEKILPRYFKMSHYKSFARQLNLWGFTCQKEGKEKGHYCHPLFVRGQRELCKSMMRKTTSATPKNDEKDPVVKAPSIASQPKTLRATIEEGHTAVVDMRMDPIIANTQIILPQRPSDNTRSPAGMHPSISFEQGLGMSVFMGLDRSDSERLGSFHSIDVYANNVASSGTARAEESSRSVDWLSRLEERFTQRGIDGSSENGEGTHPILDLEPRPLPENLFEVHRTE